MALARPSGPCERSLFSPRSLVIVTALMGDNRAEQLAIAAAPLLSGAWRYNATKSTTERYYKEFVLTDDNNREQSVVLHPITKGRQNRIEIYAQLGRFGAMSRRHNFITVSEDRTPQAIAGEIKRRVLPGYGEAIKERDALISESTKISEAHAQRVQLVKSVVSKFRGYYNSNYSLDETQFRFDNGSLRMYRDMRRYDKATLELELNFDQLIQVLHFVKEIRGRGQ